MKNFLQSFMFTIALLLACRTITMAVDSGTTTNDIETLASNPTFTSAAATNVIYVDASKANDSGDGLSWSTAKQTLQAAITLAISGKEIWVKTGTYKPGTTRGNYFGLKSGVSVYGGFAGTETSVSERTIAANETILSGEILTSASNDNCYIVVASLNISGAVLDGFTIKGGYQNGSPSGFMQNDGGGIYHANSTVTYSNLTIINNYAVWNGSGVFVTGTGLASFSNCIVADNTGNLGAGSVTVWRGASTWNNCTFAKNSPNQITIDGGTYSSTINNSIVWDGTNNITRTSGTLNLNNCDYQSTGNTGTFTTSNCISLNPKFVDATNGDYRIDGSSPCADAGNGTYNSALTDIRGFGFGRKLSKTNNSISGTIDIGAYEYKEGTDPLTGAIPTITGISPTSGPTTGATSVTITGTNLSGATAVKFGTTNAASFTVISATSITASSPAGSAGVVDITVTTSGGTSTTITSDQFTYLALPTVTAVSPWGGPIYGGTSVSITGTNLTGATAVKFGTANATSYTINSATQITATSPNGLSAGTRHISVTTAAGTSAITISDQFTYVSLPTVTSISPASGPTAGGTSVTITGTYLNDISAVKFGTANAASFTALSATSVRATSPSRSVGAVDVTVTTIGGTSNTSSSDQFTYLAAPTATTNTASNITATGATLNGSINANNASTIVTFEYGASISYGTTVTATPSPVTGSSATSVSYALSGLTASTTYHYRVKGVNTGGTTNGGDLTFTTSTASNKIYVDASKTDDTGDGLSWSTAKKTLQAALTLAVSGKEIWVKSGTYKPGNTRNSCFAIKSGVSIYGGFAGTETAVSERILTSNETILSGEIGLSTNTDNCWTVVYTEGISGALLDGFTIRDAYMNGNFGNIYPYDGGGIFHANSWVTYSNLKITRNYASWNGSAVFVRGSGQATFYNCIVSDNTGATAFTAYGGASTWTNCTFTKNSSYQIQITGNWNTNIFNNCIVWGSGQNISITSGTVDLNYCDYLSIENTGGTLTTSNCKTSDPRFVDATNGDYRINGNSPNVDAGKDSYNGGLYDIRGFGFGRKLSKTSYSLAGTIDIGAYEYKEGTDPCGVPLTQASAITFSGVLSTQMTIGWTNGDGVKRAVFVKEGTGTITNPSENTTYSASTNWVSKGTQLSSSGYYCVYNNTGNSVILTGLTAASQYTVQVFEYNGRAGSEKYLTDTASDNPKSQSTLPNPPTITGISPASGPTTGSTSVVITGTNLTAATAVKFGATNASSYTVNSATQITATSPAGSAGTVDVKVTVAGVTSATSSADQYTYVAAPTVTTQAVSSITTTTATGNGNITSLGAPNPTQYGVVWSTSTGPTTSLSTKTTQGAIASTGAFTSSITNLSTGTLYYLRAYSTNAEGTSYGTEVSFTTPEIAPADISLSSSSINENSPVGTTIGTFSTAPSSGSYSYSLVSGTGDTDNSSFSLRVNSTEDQNSGLGNGGYGLFSRYTIWQSFTAGASGPLSIISMRTTNGGNSIWTMKLKVFKGEGIGGTFLGEATTSKINVGNGYVNCNFDGITVTKDQQYTFQITDCSIDGVGVFAWGGTDNYNGGRLNHAGYSTAKDFAFKTYIATSTDIVAASSFDFETKSSYSVRVRSTELGGLYSEKAFTIAINDLAETPTTQASSIVFSSVQTTQMTIGWTNGNGYKRAVFVKQANTGTASPVNNTIYTANTVFGSGTPIAASGWYCVYNGTGTEVTITGLTAGRDYIVQVFEYNETPGIVKYYLARATNNPNTCRTSENCINPTLGGTIAIAQTGCSPFDPAALSNTAAPTGNTGTLEYKWQRSTTSDVAGFEDITNSNLATYNPGSITETTWYKRLARVTCMSNWTGAAESNAVKITVDPMSVGGAVSGESGTITYGSSTGTMRLSDHIGDVLKWQKKKGSGEWSDIDNTSATFSEIPTSVGIWQYRAQIQSGSCGAKFSDAKTVEVTQKELTISGSFTAGNKTYDGTTTATIASNLLSLVTKVGSDDVSLSAAAAFDTKYVGLAKTVSLTGSTLSGTAAGNYTLSFVDAPTTAANITATPSLGTFAAINKTYGDVAFTLVNPTSDSPGTFGYTSSDLTVATISGNTVTILKAGTSTITATQSASRGYTSATTSATLTIAKANQVITLTIPTSDALNTFIGSSVAITATASSGLPVTVEKSGTATATLNGTPGNYSITAVSSAGTAIFDASQAGDDNYNAATTIQRSFNVNLGNQTITFGTLATKTYGDAPFTVSATGGASGNPVTFASSRSIASCGGTNGTLITISGAGTVVITASQAGNSSWNSASDVPQTLVINKATPVISGFSTGINKVWGDAAFTLDAASTSPETLTYRSSEISVATVLGNTVTITGVGTSTLTVVQEAGENYTSAEASITLTVSKANQTITFGALPFKNSNDTSFDLTATSSSSLEPTYVSSNTSAATISGKKVTIVGSGTSTITASQSGNSYYNAAADVEQLLTVSFCGNPTDGGTIAAAQTGCTPFDPAALSSTAAPTGNTGTLEYKWQQSTTGSNAGYSDISDSNAATYDPGSITETTWYKRLARVTCMSHWLGAVESNVVKVTVDPMSVGGAVSGESGTITYGSSTGTMRLNDHIGDALKWQKKIGSGEWSDIDNTLATFSEIPTSVGIWQYRAQVQSGSCGAIFSDAKAVEVTQKELTISGSFTANNKTYDGTTDATIASNLLSLVTKVGSDDVSLSAAAAFDTKYVGLAKTVSLSGSTLSGTSAGNYTLSFVDAPTTAANITATPSLGTFAAINKTYGDVAFTLINPTSDSPGTFGYTSSDLTVATISGNTVTILKAGTSTITATQAASGGYDSATTSATLTIAKANQVITLTIPTSDALNTFIGSSVALTATASSGLPVTIEKSGTATATLNGTPGNYSLTAVSSAGIVIFDASQAGDDNYNAATTIQRSFNVNLGNQTITFGTLATKTYGDAPFIVSATGGASGIPVTFAASSSIASCGGTNGTTVTILGAGTVVITASQAGNSSWNAASDVPQTLVINKATPVIGGFSTGINKVWGDAAFTLDATSTSPVALTYRSSEISVATVLGNTVTITGVGTTTLTAVQEAGENYTSAEASITLTVSKANQTITFGALPIKSNNDPSFDLTATSSSSLEPTYVSNNTSVAMISGKKVTIVGSGTSTITASQSGNSYYNAAADVEQLLTVSSCANPNSGGTIASAQDSCTPFDPAALTSTAAPTGYVGMLEYKWQISTTSSNAGYSDISDSNAATYDPGYIAETSWYKRLARVTCMSNWSEAAESNVVKVTVNASPSTPTAASNLYSYSGTTRTAVAIVGEGETVDWYANVEGGTIIPAPSNTNAGSYSAYAESRNTTTGCVSSTRTLVTLDITKKELAVAADNKSHVYSGSAFTSFTVNYAGLIAGETSSVLGGTLAFNGTATTAVNVGINYVVTPSGLTSDNYEISYINGKLDITKKGLTVTAANITKVYDGNIFSPFTVAYSGFADGQTESDLAGTLSYSGSATTAVNAGANYVITPEGLTSDNYSITFIAGKLDIAKAMLTVTADAKTKIYGAANPALTFVYSGWKNDETETVLDTKPMASTTVNLISSVGTYTNAITLSGGVAENYDFTYVPASFEVTKAMLTITAVNKSKVYDGTIFSPFTVSYSGFIDGQTESVLGGTLSFTGSATTVMNVGTNYVITPGGLTAGNYSITFIAGKLDITKKALTVTAEDKSKVYDGTVFRPFTVTYSGFVNGQTAAVLGGSLSYGGTASAAVNAGANYVITPSGLTSGNYSITYVSGKLDITKKALSITAEDRSKCFDGKVYNGSFSILGSGFAAWDDVASLSGTLSFTGTANTATNVGFYTIIPGGLTSGNYNITFRNGTLSINALPVPTITGPSSVCVVGGKTTYTTEPGMIGYTWSTSGTVTSGTNQNSIDVLWNLAGAHIVVVNYIDPRGCLSQSSALKNVTVSAATGNAGNISGQASVCAGTQGVVYSTPAILNADTYVWSLPAGATITGGNSTTNITVSFAANASSGSITVYGKNPCSDGKISQAFAVTVNTAPAVPVLTADENILRSTASVGNQWYFQSTLIPGATLSTYQATHAGKYWSVVSVPGCQSALSNTINLEDIEDGHFAIYPVPNNGRFTAMINTPSPEIMTISVYNKLAEKIYEVNNVYTFGKSETVINLEGISSGIYVVEFKNELHAVRRKITINK